MSFICVILSGRIVPCRAWRHQIKYADIDNSVMLGRTRLKCYAFVPINQGYTVWEGK